MCDRRVSLAVFFCLLACRFLVEEAVVGMMIRVGFRAGCVFGLS
jgi:hypothetical protein